MVERCLLDLYTSQWDLFTRVSLKQTFECFFIVESLYWRIGSYSSLLTFYNYFHEVARRFCQEAYLILRRSADARSHIHCSRTRVSQDKSDQWGRGERDEKWVELATIIIKTFTIHVILKYTFFLWVSPKA